MTGRTSRWRVQVGSASPPPTDVYDWLPEAFAAIDGVRSRAEHPSTWLDLGAATSARWPGCNVASVHLSDERPCGFVVVEVDGADHDAARIRALAIRRALRNLGYGGEVVEQLEAAVPRRRWYAVVPRGNGLAVYFWLRIGYRPVRLDEDEALCRDPAQLWMMREHQPPSDATPGP